MRSNLVSLFALIAFGLACYAAPFALPGVVGGAWLIYPTLTPHFKYQLGIGPNPEA
jgi:hypothetical protein